MRLRTPDGRRLADRRCRGAVRRDPRARDARRRRTVRSGSLHAERDPRHVPALGGRPAARRGPSLRADLAADRSEHRDDHPDRPVAQARRRWLSRGARSAEAHPGSRGPLPHRSRAMRERLRLAVPNKGRLVEPTLNLLHDAGLVFEEHDRSLVARVQNFDLDILFVRTNDVIEFVGDGVADLGITGIDLLTETGAELPRIRSLGYGRCRLAAAVPSDTPYQAVEELDGLRVATAHPNTARRFFAERDIN